MGSSIIIRHMRKANAEIAATLKAASELYVPLTALGEIYYGIDRSGNDVRAVEQWQRFSQSVEILYPDEATAVTYSASKCTLKSKANASLTTTCALLLPPRVSTWRSIAAMATSMI